MTNTADTTQLSTYLRTDHQVRVGIHLLDNSVVELNAVVMAIEGTTIQMEAFGSSVSLLSKTPLGSPAVILSTESWAFCRCEGIIDFSEGRNFSVTINGQLQIQQRREFFRMDIFLPFTYSVAADQQLSSVEGVWKARRMMREFGGEQPRTAPNQGSFKVLDWESGPDIEPCRINLGGGGVRVKTATEFTQSTLVNMDIFLPQNSVKVITAVGSVIRSNEVRLSLDNRPAYMTAMKFTFIHEKDRDSIISFIFNEQRNSLRRQTEK